MSDINIQLPNKLTCVDTADMEIAHIHIGTFHIAVWNCENDSISWNLYRMILMNGMDHDTLMAFQHFWWNIALLLFVLTIVENWKIVKLKLYSNSFYWYIIHISLNIWEAEENKDRWRKMVHLLTWAGPGRRQQLGISSEYLKWMTRNWAIICCHPRLSTESWRWQWIQDSTSHLTRIASSDLTILPMPAPKLNSLKTVHVLSKFRRMLRHTITVKFQYNSLLQEESLFARSGLIPFWSQAPETTNIGVSVD